MVNQLKVNGITNTEPNRNEKSSRPVSDRNNVNINKKKKLLNGRISTLKRKYKRL